MREVGLALVWMHRSRRHVSMMIPFPRCWLPCCVVVCRTKLRDFPLLGTIVLIVMRLQLVGPPHLRALARSLLFDAITYISYILLFFNSHLQLQRRTPPSLERSPALDSTASFRSTRHRYRTPRACTLPLCRIIPRDARITPRPLAMVPQSSVRASTRPPLIHARSLHATSCAMEPLR